MTMIASSGTSQDPLPPDTDSCSGQEESATCPDPRPPSEVTYAELAPASASPASAASCSSRNGTPCPSAPSPYQVHSTAEYLQQLLKDRAKLAAFPGTFLHAERLLDTGE